MLDNLWAQMLQSAGRRLPAAIVDSWVRPCRLLAIEGDHLRIAAPNQFSRNWLVEHHLDVLRGAAQDCIGGDPRVSVEVDESLESRAGDIPPLARRTGVAPGTIEGLNPRYTFDSFVVGSSNQFAQADSQAVAELPSRAYNPLFIYGGGGPRQPHLPPADAHPSAKRLPGPPVR